jgi:hypothetical protein
MVNADRVIKVVWIGASPPLGPDIDAAVTMPV